MQRASRLAGRTLGQIAQEFEVFVPQQMVKAKGFAGSLVERALGASAGSRPVPDFEQLGVELKTLPVDATGRPLETTFVCTIALLDVADVEWVHSPVREKLRRVLWVPILSERSVPLAERTVGTPLLWSPSSEEEADLKWDFEELMGRLASAGSEEIGGRLGRYLQVRPKAANSRSRRVGLDSDGVRVDVLPRGFYLRTSFTARLLAAFRR